MRAWAFSLFPALPSSVFLRGLERRGGHAEPAWLSWSGTWQQTVDGGDVGCDQSCRLYTD